MTDIESSNFSISQQPAAIRDAAAHAAITRVLAELDGEALDAALARLTADNQAPAEAAEPSDPVANAKRVAFEQRLAAVCSRVIERDLSEITVPAGLHERVRMHLRTEQSVLGEAGDAAAGGGDAAEHELAAAASADRVGPAHTRDRAFWSMNGFAQRLTQHRAAAVAVAAVAVLGVTLFVMPNFSGGDTAGGAGEVAASETYAHELASFLAREHDRIAADPRLAEQKLRVREVREASRVFAERLGATPSLPAVSQAVTFRGGGDCRLPGCEAGATAHFQFVLRVDHSGGDLDVEEGIGTDHVDAGRPGPMRVDSAERATTNADSGHAGLGTEITPARYESPRPIALRQGGGGQAVTGQAVIGQAETRQSDSGGAVAAPTVQSGKDGELILVSLFVTSAADDLADGLGQSMVPGRTYQLDCEKLGIEGKRMIAWTSGDLAYLLVADDCERRGCDRFLERMELPQPEVGDWI